MPIPLPNHVCNSGMRSNKRGKAVSVRFIKSSFITQTNSQ